MDTHLFDREYAHKLIEVVPLGQLEAVIRAVEKMLSPEVLLSTSRLEDGDVLNERETLSVVESNEQFARGEGIPFEIVLAEYGLTLEQLEQMSPEVMTCQESTTSA